MRVSQCLIEYLSQQGKFIRIHFGTNGKIAGADIETCKIYDILSSSLIKYDVSVTCLLIYAFHLSIS